MLAHHPAVATKKLSPTSQEAVRTWVARVMSERGWRQEDAKRAWSVSQATVSEALTKGVLGIAALEAIANAERVSVDEILGRVPPVAGAGPRWGDDADVLAEAKRLVPRAPWGEIAKLPMPSGCVPTVRALLHLVDAIGVAREAAEVDVPLAGTRVRPVGEVVEEPLEAPAATPARAPSRRRA